MSMGLLRLLRGNKASAPVARERLQILLAHERGLRGQPDLLGVLREEILAVVSKHVTLDPTKVIVRLERGDEVSTLEVDIEVPNDFEAVVALPGVGRKTANVVLNTAFGQPTMAVDTHIFRVGNRTGLATGKNVREVEDKLIARIPQDYILDAHHYLILHGRYTCKARSPECGKCPVYDECMFKDKAKFIEK